MGQDREDRQGRPAEVGPPTDEERTAPTDEDEAAAFHADRHDDEVADALREERRLLRWELIAIAVVIVFVFVRARWLV